MLWRVLWCCAGCCAVSTAEVGRCSSPAEAAARAGGSAPAAFPGKSALWDEPIPLRLLRGMLRRLRTMSWGMPKHQREIRRRPRSPPEKRQGKDGPPPPPPGRAGRFCRRVSGRGRLPPRP